MKKIKTKKETYILFDLTVLKLKVFIKYVYVCMYRIVIKAIYFLRANAAPPVIHT